MVTANKLLLLADQTRISIDEWTRLKQMGREPSQSDKGDIEHSLRTIRQGLVALNEEHATRGYTDDQQLDQDRSAIDKVASKYQDLLDQYAQNPDVDVEPLRYSAPPQSTETVAAKKSVRFRENLEDIQEQRLFGPRANNFVEPYHDDPDMDNRDIHQQQQVTMQQQDDHLDRLAQSVSRQHELSIQIDDELTVHNQLLDDVDNYVDRSHGRLEAAKHRLEKFSRKAKENGSLLTIAILTLIFIILVVVLK
uniref:ARAD1A13442p n=1 Tax=Blastobotrys adeninivorans TaxID=409370 RepID=A0A060SYN2_BLAAD